MQSNFRQSNCHKLQSSTIYRTHRPPAKLLSVICSSRGRSSCCRRQDASQIRVSTSPPDPRRQQEHILPERQRGDHTQLWHALREQHFRKD